METQQQKEFLIQRIINLLSQVGGVMGAICLLVVSVIITYEAFMRYFFNAPTIWVKEISIYLCIAIGFLAAAYTLQKDSHFAITIFVDRLSRTHRRRLRIVTHLIGIIYTSALVYKGIHLVTFSYEMSDVSTSLLEVPLWIPKMLVPVGCSILTLQFVNKLIEEIAQRNPS